MSIFLFYHNSMSVFASTQGSTELDLTEEMYPRKKSIKEPDISLIKGISADLG